LLLPVFALYSFHVGYRRLAQEQFFSQLQQLGRPVWWVSIHRLANTVMLLAVTFAVVTGRMMNEEWLPAGEVNHAWYLAHLCAWVCVFVSLALHLLLGAKVGGMPLLILMVSWRVLNEDTPRFWLRGLRFNHSNLILKIIEVIVIGGIITAFILPVFNA
jgi:hypothetical protein